MKSGPRIRFISYRSATGETLRAVRALAKGSGLDAIRQLDAGTWIALELDEEGRAKLDALAELGVEFELDDPSTRPPPTPTPIPTPTPPPVARTEVPAAFDLRASLRYMGGGGVRAARLLTSSFDLELDEAIALERGGGELARALPIAEAEAHAAALTELGGQVEVEPDTSWAYAFDPRAGADQALERLRVIGPELVVERGALGHDEWTTSPRELHPTPSERDAAVLAVHEAWKAGGRVWVETPAELVARVRARNRALEAEIRAADDPRPLYAVYGDWLMNQGDPLGALREARAAGQVAFRAALDEHAVHLFWPLGQARERAKLTWRDGLVHRVAVDASEAIEGFATVGEFVTALLELPCCACVRELELRGPSLELTGEMHVDALTGLRSLALEAALGDVRVLDWTGLSRLEALEIRAHHPKLEPFRLPRLNRLRLRLDRLGLAGVEAFEQAELGALAHLVLVFEDRPARSDLLERALTSRALSTVRTARIEVRGAPIDGDFVSAIVDSRLYRNARMIELVAKLDRIAEIRAGRAAPTLRIRPEGPGLVS